MNSETTKIKPIAVLTSDLHFNINTLPLASKALTAALSKANELQIPLIVAGDLHDTKAIIRAEVANELIKIFSSARTPVYVMVGNHDLINEHGTKHGLNYLKPYVTEIVDNPDFIGVESPYLCLIPYMHDIDNLKQFIKETKKFNCNTLIMHQGFLGAHLGDYIQDKTSISPDTVKDFTVISGHYHRHQTIGTRKSPNSSIGTITYIGSPYTMSFGEYNDGPKGFLILNKDGTYTREILNLRKHIKLQLRHDDLYNSNQSVRSEDLLWVQVSGPSSELDKINKQELGMSLIGHSNYKLDLVPDNSQHLNVSSQHLTDREVFDTLITELKESDDYKTYLKELYHEIIAC